jgi:hypothetical protein
MESNEHLDWFETLDEFIDEQDIVLDALKHGLAAGNISEDEAEEYRNAYIRNRFEKPM